MKIVNEQLSKIFPLTFSVLSPLTDFTRLPDNPVDFSGAVQHLSAHKNAPPFAGDLARLEHVVRIVRYSAKPPKAAENNVKLNPTLELVDLSYQLCDEFLRGEINRQNLSEPEYEYALVWKHPATGKIHLKSADAFELIALKIVAEGLDEKSIAEQADKPVSAVRKMMYDCVERGILLAPPSGIRRKEHSAAKKFTESRTFTIQWHITHACDLNCKHCYDRSRRSPLTLKQGQSILSDMVDFTESRHVSGHVCFSGGNPFMYPDFFNLYRTAADAGFTTSVLGNPVNEEKLDTLLTIQQPEYFQVSLEGLEKNNDKIRGKGFYRRVLDFLDLLRKKEISSAVMLTLTAENMEDVLKLAEILRNRTDHFTFNRLSPVGEGAQLLMPPLEKYMDFLDKYVDAAQENPVMGYKDNLINQVLKKKGLDLFEGCTGDGCGAAFNFIALLPDGEAHACRKFPSPIGNVIKQGIADVYCSEAAEKYRNGTKGCLSCRLRPVCGGCLAVISGSGGDISRDVDPYCLLKKETDTIQAASPSVTR